MLFLQLLVPGWRVGWSVTGSPTGCFAICYSSLVSGHWPGFVFSAPPLVRRSPGFPCSMPRLRLRSRQAGEHDAEQIHCRAREGNKSVGTREPQRKRRRLRCQARRSALKELKTGVVRNLGVPALSGFAVVCRPFRANMRVTPVCACQLFCRLTPRAWVDNCHSN